MSPKIVSTSPPKISVPYGTSFSLKCGVRGYPEPVVTWSYDDVPLTGKTEGVTIGESSNQVVGGSVFDEYP